MRFRAMGCDAELYVVGGPPALRREARALVETLERTWSRFVPTSDVSRLNEAGGRPVAVTPETRLLVARAVHAWRITGGAFDPTMLDAIVAAGYDRSFEQLDGSTDRQAVPSATVAPTEIEIGGDTVRLPAGVGFDPGGIGKGLAGDLVCERTLAAGAEGVCVNIGGDVRVAGAGPAGGAWTVAVEHPHHRPPLALVGLSDGAIATSTTLRRRWWTSAGEQHHLLDPWTRRPSRTDIELTSVVAGQGWLAEVLAKAVLLRAGPHPFDILGGTGAAGLVVRHSGRVEATPGLADFLGGASVPTRLVGAALTANDGRRG